LGLEFSNVNGMRRQTIAKERRGPSRKLELMVSEKLEALTQASADVMAAASAPHILADMACPGHI
jgi:hypothetical protein